MIRAFLSLAKICMNLYEFLQSAHVLPYRAEIVQRAICRKCISYTAFEKDGSTQDGRNDKSQMCSKWPRMWQKTAIHPLVETTWPLQVLYPQVKMSIENQLKHEG